MEAGYGLPGRSAALRVAVGLPRPGFLQNPQVAAIAGRLPGRDTSVSIVASDHPKEQQLLYQAGLAVTDGEHPPSAGPGRWPHIT